MQIRITTPRWITMQWNLRSGKDMVDDGMIPKTKNVEGKEAMASPDDNMQEDNIMRSIKAIK
ncbi:MAG: hypothetical protein CL912_09165 [Deltaproteobacteria bacterium]|nr:hypothetical protein [Deltaproteobacteria bacterium]